jgi:predicted aspartyl protease
MLSSVSSSVIPLRLVAGEPYATLTVRVNEIRTFRMMIDTGSTRTVLTPRAQQRLDLDVRPGLAVVASGERVLAGRVTLTSLEIDGFLATRVENLSVRVMNLPFADGLLGLDYLSHFAEVCYSFADSALRLTSY